MVTDQAIQDGRHDFDFHQGTWKVHNRRLKERLKGSNEWEEFEAISVAQSILGGIGNLDTLTMERESATIHAVTLRLFNPITKQWSLYWSESVTGVLYSPMIGKFTDGIGHFYDREVFENQTIISRFIWSNISAITCRWEQAFSIDGGATWETNWTMDGTKIS